MKRKILLILSCVSYFIVESQTISPQVVTTTGASSEGTTVTLDWSIGEVIVTTIQTDSNQITQGFHQGQLIITPIEELTKEYKIIQVYPNPTMDKISIDIELEHEKEIQVKFYDNKGSLLWTYNNKTQVLNKTFDISQFSAGQYTLHFLIDDDQLGSLFTIQKIK